MALGGWTLGGPGDVPDQPVGRRSPRRWKTVAGASWFNTESKGGYRAGRPGPYARTDATGSDLSPE